MLRASLAGCKTSGHMQLATRCSHAPPADQLPTAELRDTRAAQVVPAHKAGVHVGDIVTAINGRPAASISPK